MGGGGASGGGDGGYAEEKAKEEERRRAARALIARIFGLQTDRGAAPVLADFALPVATSKDGGALNAQGTTDDKSGVIARVPTQEDLYDVPAYDAALARWNATDSETEANRTARLANYDMVRGDVRSFHQQRVKEDLAKVARQVKQALLRSGQYGGSGQIDRETELDRQYSRGIMDISNLADQTASGLEASDMNTYGQLISSINAGMEGGDAANLAAQQMNTGAQRALQQAQGVSFANLFDRMTSDLANQAYLRGQQRVPQYQAPTIATPGYGGSGGGVGGRRSMGMT